jgi:hypothetical protein
LASAMRARARERARKQVKPSPQIHPRDRKRRLLRAYSGLMGLQKEILRLEHQGLIAFAEASLLRRQIGVILQAAMRRAELGS